FRFRDASEWKRAFTYDWRVWNLPEVRELMLDAGFERADVYWEGTDRKTDEGNGIFTRREVAEQCDAWIAYIVGVKRK
ncbi:MAG: class I SAM-dependent methyltransferase, partial [Planctomycetota bacterium]